MKKLILILFLVISPLTACSTISEINENTKQSNVLYPNPSSGVFNLNSNNFSDLKVVDVLGKIVYEKNSLENTQTINLKHLPFGFYQCVLSSKEDQHTQKIQILK